MTKDEALKMALEALEQWNTPLYKRGTAITAIKEALAQPEQEPVIGTKTWFEDGKVVTQHLTAKDIYKEPEQIPPSVYSNTHQPEQEQIQPDKVCIEDDGCPTEKAVLQRFWREHQKTQPEQRSVSEHLEPVATVAEVHMSRYTIEWTSGSLPEGTKLYTTPPQPEQEPVAWAQFSETGNLIDLLEEPCGGYVPLYTTPPQRTWQGLTDDEIDEIDEVLGGDIQDEPNGLLDFVRAIEAKLKEKNSK